MGISTFGQDDDKRRYRGLYPEGNERKHQGLGCVQRGLFDNEQYLEKGQKTMSTRPSSS